MFGLLGVMMLTGRSNNALAEENLVGKIAISDGGSVCNFSTGYLSPDCTLAEGNCFKSFALPSGNKKITVWCDAAAFVTVSRSGCDAGIGAPLAANEKFPTDTGKTVFAAKLPDGGTYTGAAVCFSPAVGASSTNCSINFRTGLE